MPAARDVTAYAVVGLIAAFYLLYGLDAYGILNNNEGLYAEMAREMTARGAPGMLTLNGVPYLEKPPLLPWLLAAVYAVTGPSELASRSIAVVSSSILLVALMRFARLHAGPRVAWLAGLILASCLVQALIMRTVLPDVLLVMLFSASMFLFFRWHCGLRNASLVGSYACLGLAVLAKGFVAPLLAALVFAIFGRITARAWRLRDLLHPAALAVLAALALAWPLYLAITNFDYAWFFVVNEHVLRYLGLREPKDYYTGPIYYYLPRVLLALFPWTAFVPLLAWRSRGQSQLSDPEKLAWVWLCVCLVFFSLSTAKGNYYLSIAMPPLAYLLAVKIEAAANAGKQRLLALLSSLLAAAVTLILVALHWNLWAPQARQFWRAVLRLDDLLQVSLLACALLITCGAVLLARRMARAGLSVLALSGAPLLMFLVVAARNADPYLSQRALADHLRTRYPAAQVYLFQDYEDLASLPFYLRSEVPVVDSRSNDLAFGQRHMRDSPNFVSLDQFRAASRERPVVLLVHRRRNEAFSATLGHSGLRYRARIGAVSVFSGER